MTFPASETATPAHTLADWPGIDSIVQFGEGIDIGYRWDQANGVRPLFPFGFGLSYTSFSLSKPTLRDDGDGGVTVSLSVTNTGRVGGSEVVQAYVGFPSDAAEPPWQLKAFTRVSLSPHASTTAELVLPASSFQCFRDGSWRTEPGRYVIGVGTSSDDLAFEVSLQR